MKISRALNESVNDSVKSILENIILERGKKYFGEDFIASYDNLRELESADGTFEQGVEFEENLYSFEEDVEDDLRIYLKSVGFDLVEKKEFSINDKGELKEFEFVISTEPTVTLEYEDKEFIATIDSFNSYENLDYVIKMLENLNELKKGF